MATATLHTGHLPAARLSAVKRRSMDLGLTPEKYLQQLIEDDLFISAKAKSTSLHNLAAPFRQALRGVSDTELDRRVKAARASRLNGSSTRRR